MRSLNVSFVSKEGWLRINHEETRAGASHGAPRRKLESIEAMLQVAATDSKAPKSS